MRVLIVTVTTGGGHNATANAVASQFRKMGITDVIVEDMYEYCNRLLYKALDRGYLFTTHYMPKQFGSTYNRLDKHALLRKLFAVLTGNNTYIAKKFSSYFNAYNPDVIITSHVFSAQVLNELKKQGRINMPVIGIITDYCIHPYWEDCHNIDYIITASEFINYNAIKKNMDLRRILPFGIPVNPKFIEKIPKQEAREKLGLRSGAQTILIMSGSMGYGKLLPTVEEILAENRQVVCVCGNNKKLYHSLLALDQSDDKLRVLGFIKNVEVYMDAADCIITKPGGLSTTELIVKNLPAVIINPIPGPEEHNMRFLLKSGGAVKADKSNSISKVLDYLFKTPGRLGLMEKSLHLIAHPDAAERLCSFTIELCAVHRI